MLFSSPQPQMDFPAVINPSNATWHRRRGGSPNKNKTKGNKKIFV